MKLLLMLFIPFLPTTPIPYRQLSWSDFKGKPTNDHAASTCTGIVIEKDTAYAIFEPDKSWTRTQSAEVLKHEQIHFAITRAFAHKIVVDIYFAPGGKEVIAQDLEEWERRQELFDKESDHGRNLEQQKRYEDYYLNDFWDNPVPKNRKK